MGEDNTSNTVTGVTRRAIIDYLTVGRHWSGVLSEDDFLGRLYDLSRMPSTDTRREYDTAAKDIWKHRVMNSDWPDDWIFTDSRFGLLFGPDEPFLRFLAETVHPIVRPDIGDAEAMVEEFNALLRIDGWEIYSKKRISDNPVFYYRRLLGPPAHLEEAERVAARLTGSHIAQQIRRLQASADTDPELAIGTAKEFLESVCMTILAERNLLPLNDEDFPTLVRSTVKSVPVIPRQLSSQTHLGKTITVLLNNLGSIGQQLAELRNQFGTGHGRPSEHVGLPVRHAKLAVGAATALGVFLYECHESTRATRDSSG
jgi:hypothetical protein